MVPVITLSAEALVARGASEAVVVRVGLLMFNHVSSPAERLLTKEALVGFDTCRKEDFMNKQCKSECK